ncbi:HECT-domain protein [Ancylostoma caninum]|uniref:HECT-type E3 ubiquitin transferase n=1 Tax=Ancylostoma caninum TaxID=29170 RepID=A0A368FU27_ANCCA|nr:HECT-domain protein [Ancylostoma caninum]
MLHTKLDIWISESIKIAVLCFFIVSDEEKFLLLSACAGYKQAMHQLDSEGKLALPEEQEARSFMISSIDAAFESPAFSALCKNAVLSPTDENVWSLVAFEKQIRNSDTVMLLATSSACMNRLWQLLMGLQSRCASGRLANHIDLLKMGHPLDDASRDRLTQTLSLFCGCLVASVTSVDDSDFVAGHSNIVFSSSKLTEIITVIRDVGLGLIDLAFPEDFFVTAKAAEERHRDAAKWSNLYETVVSTLQSLYAKDSRVHFLPHEFWSNHQRQVVVTRRSFLPPRRRGLGMEAQQRMFTPFSFVRFLHGRPRMDGDSSDSDEEAGPSHDLPATSADMRNLSIIRSIPFVVPFMQRVKIFQDLLAHDREANDIVDDFHSFAGIGSRRHGITIAVRRQHLYEDAFEALSLGNAPNLRLPIRVSMTNWVGLNEVGIDGGGIFRRFLTELLRTGFDPDRGFFKYTHDRLLYPNPSSVHLYPDSYSQHFFFLGRVVAKVYDLCGFVADLIYEKQMAEIRFAEFFVAQLLGRRQMDVDLHHMKSYDPAIYKHLKNLRTLTADELAALELDFSVIVDDVGDVQVITFFFFSNFSSNQLSNSISNYEADRDYMNLFWSVVSEMSPEDKRGLLKFITGCSRPPIEGFKMLYPAIGIQLVHDSDHLPTSATCMNLFKLPIYSSRAKLEDKLRYAINAGAGFELS